MILRSMRIFSALVCFSKMSARQGKALFLILFTLFGFLNVQGQACLPNGITFASQSEINNFPVNYPGCTVIEGDVNITAPGGSNISNLNGLSGLTAIGGRLNVYFNPLLTNLSGLDNITTIGAINIEFNWSLSSLSGLGNLTAVQGNFALIQNEALTSLSGLSNLTTVGGDLELLRCTSLPDLTGLNKLNSVGGTLRFFYNPILTNMTGLGSLATVGSLSIENHPVLTSLTGLNSLNTISGELYLTGNDVLASLGGLNSLSSLGSLWFWYNNGLSDVNGLNNITAVIGNINIQQNPALTSLSGLSNITDVGGNLWISGSALANLNGLNNITHVGGGLSVGSNPLLVSLSGLNNITSVGGYVGIGYNSILTDLSGLGQITTVGGGMTISSNDVLTNLDGLNQLASLGNVLYIQDNPLLTSLSGLESLVALDSGLVIIRNASLTSLSDLGNVTSIGTLNIWENATLKNLNGLEHITTIQGGVGIKDNPLLTDLSGLSHITTITDYLSISGNTVLPNLSDLTNLASVKRLTVSSNASLINLNGLENLDCQYINITSNNALTDLNGWVSPQSMKEVEISGNPVLNNLSALANLKTVEEGLKIVNNDAMTNLNGLDNVDSVGYVVWIGQNDALTSLSGLGKLKTAGAYLGVYDCPVLVNLEGLNGLRKVGDYLSIERNASLSNLNGLEGLINVGDIVAVQDNPALQNVQALSHLKTPIYYLWIQNNPGLTSLDGLGNIPKVDGQILITGNTSLTDCSIFSVCNALLNEPPNQLNISNNASGCNSPGEAEAACKSRPVTVQVLLDNNGNNQPIENIRVALSGSAQMNLKPTDSNGFAGFSFLENGPFLLHLPQAPDDKWQISEQRFVLTSSTGVDSTHIVLLLSPLAPCPELTATLGLPSFFRGCLVNSEIVISVQNTGTALAEGARASLLLPPVLELMASMPLLSGQNGDTLFFELGDLKPFETAEARLTVKTSCDTFLLNHTLCIETFEDLNNPCPATTPAFSEIKLSAQCLGNNTVRFTLKNIGDAPTQSWHEYRIIRNDIAGSPVNFSLAAQQSMTVDVPADSATYRMEATKFDNGFLTATALENCGGLNPGFVTAFWFDEGGPEYDFDCREVRGSFDPNLKSAIPTGVEIFQHNIEANRPIQYTIDFQNTGTDTAFRVLLRDVLPSNLDMTSFQPVIASHPNTWEIRGNTLEVLFQPIALPDSNANQPASHGFFSFSINQKPNLPDGTVFYNQYAEIVFDFNPPIYTNYVIHIIGRLSVDVFEPGTGAAVWEVWGNPARDMATFRTATPVAGEKTFKLYDAVGKLVRLEYFSDQAFDFQRGVLQAGVYFFSITDEKGSVFSGKIVITQ
jgi:uncharacterized repeat protein (TIGR01451 family)